MNTQNYGRRVQALNGDTRELGGFVVVWWGLSLIKCFNKQGIAWVHQAFLAWKADHTRIPLPSHHEISKMEIYTEFSVSFLEQTQIAVILALYGRHLLNLITNLHKHQLSTYSVASSCWTLSHSYEYFILSNNGLLLCFFKWWYKATMKKFVVVW